MRFEEESPIEARATLEWVTSELLPRKVTVRSRSTRSTSSRSSRTAVQKADATRAINREPWRTPQSRRFWQSFRRSAMLLLAVPGLIGTLALPAFAFTESNLPPASNFSQLEAQSLNVNEKALPILVNRDTYSATTTAELTASRAAAAAAAKKASDEAARLAAQAAAGTAARAFDPNRSSSASTDADLSGYLDTVSTVWQRPVAGPISSPYGPRGLICNGAGCSNSFHDGMDFSADCGTPIKAVSAGRVTFTGSGGSYGQRVIVDHGGGVETIYGHVQTGSFKVAVGDLIEGGTIVALVGATGVVSGCHLDLKVQLDGKFTNPQTYLEARGAL
ncbi:hypothetical protein ALI44B_09120 [Leifsonia sp. ALI-44-B]|nr:hypothetical protein ALI44B_09120 [Leifsonia sp. ALI-44-B]